MTVESHWQTIDEVRSEAVVCCRCDLCYGRKHVVFGEGPVPARLMLVGEGPGEQEDEQGRPFVGRAGKLLDDLLSESGLSREECWVTNIVRCRPTTKQGGVLRNRAPTAAEISACDLWMTQEFRFVSPEFVVCLGAVPAKALVSRSARLSTDRGRWHTGRNGIPTVVTYHPAYVLRLRTEDRSRVESAMLDDLRMVADRLRRVSGFT